MNNYLKTTIWILGGVILVSLVGYGVWYFEKQKLPETSNPKYLETKDLKLTDPEKKIYQDKIVELQQKLAEAKDTNTQFPLLMQIGFQHFGLGEYAKAREQYFAASKLLPDNPTPYAALYESENAMMDYEGAKLHLQRAIELNPVSAQYWRWMIELREIGFRDTPEQLEKYYQDALDKTHGSVDIVTLYAKFLEKKGDLPGAVAQWKKAIEKDPSQTEIFQAEITRIQNLVK